MPAGHDLRAELGGFNCWLTACNSFTPSNGLLYYMPDAAALDEQKTRLGESWLMPLLDSRLLSIRLLPPAVTGRNAVPELSVVVPAHLGRALRMLDTPTNFIVYPDAYLSECSR